MPPLVSVLTTVYNRAPYLAACIESVLAQSMGDLELIVVDDCSTDGSFAVAEQYRSDPRIRLYRNERNLGDYPNRNRAASLARGIYLKYVDGDDLIYPHCLELMVEGIDAFPEAGYGLSRDFPQAMAPVLLTPAEAYREHFFGSGLFASGPLDAIIRRDAFDAVGGFSPARYTSDTDFFLRIGARWAGVILVPGLVWWRHHPEQESLHETASIDRVMEVILRRHGSVCAALNDPACPLSADEIATVRRLAIRRIQHLALGRARRGRWGWAARTLREAHCDSQANRQPDIGQRQSAGAPAHAAPLATPQPHPKASAKSARRSKLPLLRPPLGKPLVSILIPAHHAEATIARAIQSVLDQCFQDWELILVDDAGTDNTANIALQYQDDPRLSYERNQQRLGKWPNHLKAANLARGRYLKFLHADDQLYPNALRLLCDGLEASGGDEIVMPTDAAPPGRWRIGPADTVRYHYFIQPVFGSLLVDGLISRKLFLDVARLTPDTLTWDVTMGVQCLAAAGVTYCPPGIVHHARLHLLGIGRSEKYPMGLAEAFAAQCRMLLNPTLELTELERLIIERHLRYGFARRLQRLILRGRWGEARAALSRNGLGLEILRALRSGPHESRHQIRADLAARLFH